MELGSENFGLSSLYSKCFVQVSGTFRVFVFQRLVFVYPLMCYTQGGGGDPMVASGFVYIVKCSRHCFAFVHYYCVLGECTLGT
jgi:hypothetical protein